MESQVEKFPETSTAPAPPTPTTFSCQLGPRTGVLGLAGCPTLSRGWARPGGGGRRQATPARSQGPGSTGLGQGLRASALDSSRPSLSAASRGHGLPSEGGPSPAGPASRGPSPGAALGWTDRGRRTGRLRLPGPRDPGRADFPYPGELRPPWGRRAGLGSETLTEENRPEIQERALVPASVPAWHKLDTHVCLSEHCAKSWACKEEQP